MSLRIAIDSMALLVFNRAVVRGKLSELPGMSICAPQAKGHQ